MKPFQYPVMKNGRKILPAKSIRVEQEPEPEIGLVQGKMPQSKEEWWLALALAKYGIRFFFQVPLSGGRLLPGGRVLDFLLDLTYLQPVLIDGPYWHQDRDRENLTDDLLRREYGVEPIHISTLDLPTPEAAERVVRERFR
jgi:hypothetical protein